MITRTPRLRSAAAICADAIARYDLIAPGEAVLVALSGGADSSALALVLETLGYDLALGHVDHGLRPDSAEDVTRCAAIASHLEVPFAFRRVTVEVPTEAEARTKRYEALEDMALEIGTSKIATGHTLDDQAETVLMRLARGGQPIGIPYRRGRIVRPILDLRRSDTIAICQSAGIEFVRDPSNVDTRITRNLIRHKVLPKFSDEVVLRLARAGRVATEAAVERAGRIDAVSHLHIRAVEGRVEVDRAILAGSDRNFAYGLFRNAIQGVGLDPTEQLVRHFIDKVIASTGASAHLPGGWIARVEPQKVVIERRSLHSIPSAFRLRIPGTTELPEWKMTAFAEVLERDRSLKQESVSPLEAHLDFDRVGDRELVVRSRLEGDRFHPLGMRGSKKLQDFLVDSKVPRAERNHVPIVVAGEEIVWVVGYRIDEGFKTDSSTSRILHLRFAGARGWP